jgi:hypothetical protein
MILKPVKKQLSIATCTLLSHPVNDALAIENNWEIDNSFLYYNEADNRVSVAEYAAVVAGDVSDRDRVSMRVVLDTMSGATPSGAVINSGSTNTVTGASGGGGSGTTDPNASALVDFDDTRLADSLSWTHEHDNNLSVTYNASVSIENDYQSYSGAATVNKETSDKKYLFSLGTAFTHDTIFRIGGQKTPVPLSQIADNDFNTQGARETVDFIAGVTRVINRRTIGQANLAYGVSNGYHTDPYKVFSVVDRATDIVINDSSYYESRPDNRKRASLTFHINHQTYPANNIIHGSYRFYSDSWGVDSHTFDFSYRDNLEDRTYIEPRIRLYAQSKANFYQNQFYVDDAGASDPSLNFPDYISADYRLDDMVSITPGVRIGSEVGKDGHLRGRLEYMYQSFKHSDFSKNKAIILQIAYSKRF